MRRIDWWKRISARADCVYAFRFFFVRYLIYLMSKASKFQPTCNAILSSFASICRRVTASQEISQVDCCLAGARGQDCAEISSLLMHMGK
jgi:hypothetical protein